MDNEKQTETNAPDAPATDMHKHRRSEYIAQGFHNKTKGEAFFNSVVYLGFAYIGVMAVSIFSSWLLRDSNTLAARKFKDAVGWVQTKFKGNRSGTALESFNKTVDSNMTIAAFFTGGTVATVLPVKWLEDKKASIVKSLDTVIYGREKVDNDPKIIEAHRMLEEAPKQTWLSVFTSRLIAFGMTFGTSALVGPQSSPIGKLTGHSIDRDTAKFGRFMDKRANREYPEIVSQIERAAAASPNSILREGPNADRIRSRIWSYVGLDAIYTLITGVTLFVSTRVLAPIFGKENDPVSPLPTPRRHDTPAPFAGLAPGSQAAANAHPSQRISAAEAEHHARLESSQQREITA